MHTVTAPTRVRQMPLPPWAADAASKLADTESLVLLEGKMDGRRVICVTRYVYAVPQNRIEFQIIAVIRDADMQVDVDPGEVTLYPLEESAVPVIEIEITDEKEIEQ